MFQSIKSKIGNFFARTINHTFTAQLGSGISSHQTYPSSTEYGSGSKFHGGMASSRLVSIHNHFSLRQFARDAMYDSVVAKGMVDRFADTVVDTGLRVKPTPVSILLGITPEQAEQWAEDVAEKFHLWASSKKSHRSRINNFYQNQHLYEKFQQRDNDIFVRFYYTKDKDQSSPLSMEFIDPNQIRGYSYTSTYAQYPGDDGIIRDSAGREIGFKIWNFNRDTGGYEDTTVPAIGEKSGRIFMIHGYNPEYAGQGRGYSRLSHVIQEFKQLTNFEISTIQKAINQASISMFTQNAEKDASNPLAGISAGPAREYGAVPQPSAEAQNVTNASLEPVVNYKPLPEATFNAPSVGVFNLRRGDELKPFQDSSPSQMYNSFVDAFCSYLCASTGMPIELLLMKFNANYSASRATLIMFWRVCQIWRDEMAADFLNPTYEMWLSEEIAAGRIQANGWNDPLMRSAWLSSEWSGSNMPNIDPLKSMEASKLGAELGAETLDDIAREYNGSSGKSNRAKNARQFSELPEVPWKKVAPAPAKQQKDGEE